MSSPLVAIIMGSSSDSSIAEKAIEVLKEYAVNHEVRVLSAHRNPTELDAYLQTTKVKVIIAVAGLSAALPGVVASRVTIPVIGVPVSAKLGGLDALFSIAQMPPGVPVACVGIDNAKNAALLACRILKLTGDLP